MNLKRYSPQIEWRAEGALPYMCEHEAGKWHKAADVSAALAAAREEGWRECKKAVHAVIKEMYDAIDNDAMTLAALKVRLEELQYTPPSKGEKGTEG